MTELLLIGVLVLLFVFCVGYAFGLDNRIDREGPK